MEYMFLLILSVSGFFLGSEEICFEISRGFPQNRWEISYIGLHKKRWLLPFLPISLYYVCVCVCVFVCARARASGTHFC
jgi:hypothetical protein